MKTILTPREYVSPAFRTVRLAAEYQFLASSLEDYPDNPIFHAPAHNDSEEDEN